MGIYQRGDIWWADVTIDGHRTRRSLETSSKPEALKRERDLIKSPKATRPRGKTLEDALGLWLDERERGRSDLSILARLSGLPAVQAADVDDAWARTHLGKLGPANFNRHLTVLHAALVMAKQLRWIADVPTFGKKRPPAGRTRFLTRPEWSRLHGHLPEHLKPLCAFALATGLRQDNVLRLTWAKVDLDQGLAWVEAEDAKGGKTLSIPLSSDAIEILRGEEGRHPEFVFTWGKKVRRPFASTPKTAWLAAVEEAKLEGVTFHTLRHTWASWHVMAGTPLPVLQQLGGWASFEMVQRYAHLAPGHIAEFASRVTIRVTPEKKPSKLKAIQTLPTPS